MIPVELGLLDSQGAEIPLRLAGEAAADGTSRVISVTEAEQTFTFVDIAEQPLPSLLRGFSAPVKLSFPYNRDQLMFLMQHDSDGFNRWDAGQQLSVQVLQELIAQHQQGASLVLDPRLVSALRSVLSDESLDQAMVAEMLSLPSEAYLTEISEVADVEAIHAAREFARQQLAENLFEALWLRYAANRDLSKKTPYVAEAEHFARRALQNIALSYLMLTGKPEVLSATLEQFDTADNMTERLTALAVLVNSPFEAEKAKALEVFAENFKGNPLVMDQWFSVQAGSPLPGGLARVKALMEHPAFNIKNPNKVRALVGGVCRAEPDQLPRGRRFGLSLPGGPGHPAQWLQPADRLPATGPADSLAQIRQRPPGADEGRTGAHPGIRRAFRRCVRGGEQEPGINRHCLTFVARG
nr:hypothetical protein GCM10020185_69550 [Pseudomonas brassicacearum subsp. brassicacearum]